MGEVLSNKEYLNSGLDSIQTASKAGLDAVASANKYGSTTKVPAAEPPLIEQLLKASKEIFTKLNNDVSNIRTVGEGFQTMDDFLAGQSIDLGFQVQSYKSSVVELSEFAATSLESLLEKEVPIVEGYNDGLDGKTKKSEDDDDDDRSYGGYGGPSSNGGEESTPTPTPSTTPTTTPPTNPPGGEVQVTEPETGPGEPTTETEWPTTEPVTEAITEVITEIVTEAPTSAPSKPAPSKPTKTHSSTPKVEKYEQGVNTNEQPVEVPTVIDEPIVDEGIEEPVIEDESIIEEPVIDDYEQEPIIDIDDQIIDIDTPVDEAQAPKKSNSGKVAAGVIAGLGLAAGAGAAGYTMYKKSQEDKEYEDYGYEDDGGDQQ